MDKKTNRNQISPIDLVDARVSMEKVRRLRTHSSAVHSVLEQIRVMSSDGPQTAWVIATNVYVQTAQGWRLVAHHASPGSPHEVHEVVEAGNTLH